MNALLRYLDARVSEYMRHFAANVVRQQRPFIVGITGSVGKTTTTVTIGAAFQHPAVAPHLGRVQYTRNNMNGSRGLPLVVLGYDTWPPWKPVPILTRMALAPRRAARMAADPDYPKVLVLEYALGSRSSVRASAASVPPHVAIVTPVGPAHVERYGSVEAIVANKRALVEAVPSHGLVILNADNVHAASMASASRAPVHLVPGSGVAFARAAARIIGEHLGVPIEALEIALAELPPLRRRQELLELGSIRVMDDSFNANPLSMRYGLDTFAAAALPGERRVAILGHMAELGADSARYHQEIGAYARRCADLVVGVGDHARPYAPDLYFRTAGECAAALGDFLSPRDFVLLKGSSSVKLVEVRPALQQIARQGADV